MRWVEADSAGKGFAFDALSALVAVIGTAGQRAGRPRSDPSDEVGRALIMAAERSEGTVARRRDRGLDEGSARPMM